jgi:hypothetical protein
VRRFTIHYIMNDSINPAFVCASASVLISAVSRSFDLK